MINYKLEQICGMKKGEDKGSVVACDFYNSGALMSLSDEEILSILKDRLLPSAVPAFNDANVVDFEVRKYADAVSWFSPGSYRTRPSLAVKGVSNIVCAGDWVKLGEREHGAKGLCQERAFVSGLEAANQLGMVYWKGKRDRWLRLSLCEKMK